MSTNSSKKSENKEIPINTSTNSSNIGLLRKKTSLSDCGDSGNCGSSSESYGSYDSILGTSIDRAIFDGSEKISVRNY